MSGDGTMKSPFIMVIFGATGDLSRYKLIPALFHLFQKKQLPHDFFLFGFAMVWHIIWLAVVGLVGAIACFVVRAFEEEPEYVVTAAEVEKMEKDPRKYSYLS